MMPITQNLMPMGQAAEKFSGNGSVLPPMPPGAPAPMPAAPPSNPSTGGGGMPSFNPPDAPTQSPFTVIDPNGDGATLVMFNGKVVGFNKPPNLPKEMQQQMQPAGIPHALQPPQ